MLLEMERPNTGNVEKGTGQSIEGLKFSNTSSNFGRNRPNTATLRNINEEDEFEVEKEKIGFTNSRV